MLIKCSECEKEVSDSAVTCPHCGKQLKGRGFWGRIFLLVFYEFNLYMLAWVAWKLCVSMMPVDGHNMAVLAFFWCVGSVITGLPALLTRPWRTPASLPTTAPTNTLLLKISTQLRAGVLFLSINFNNNTETEKIKPGFAPGRFITYS